MLGTNETALYGGYFCRTLLIADHLDNVLTLKLTLFSFAIASPTDEIMINSTSGDAIYCWMSDARVGAPLASGGATARCLCSRNATPPVLHKFTGTKWAQRPLGSRTS
jgi:hypothetical protein